jgi:hypothetical protein
LECFLGFGQRLGQRIFKLRVDSPRNRGGIFRILDLNNENANLVGAPGR